MRWSMSALPTVSKDPDEVPVALCTIIVNFRSVIVLKNSYEHSNYAYHREKLPVTGQSPQVLHIELHSPRRHERLQARSSEARLYHN